MKKKNTIAAPGGKNAVHVVMEGVQAPHG